jgi:hypothetical protein
VEACLLILGYSFSKVKGGEGRADGGRVCNVWFCPMVSSEGLGQFNLYSRDLQGCRMLTGNTIRGCTPHNEPYFRPLERTTPGLDQGRSVLCIM